MGAKNSHLNSCVIIGANQAGVSIAFALREKGWKGDITLFDMDPELPYYRPPLSKSVLIGSESLGDHALKPIHLYKKENITLKLGHKVTSIDRISKQIFLDNGSFYKYDILVLAMGGRPIIPNIPGLKNSESIFTIRTSRDTIAIRNTLDKSEKRRALIIGAGYIGLETAASLIKLKANVTVLEKEERVLSRVTAPHLSNFYEFLHKRNGVEIFTNKEVIEVRSNSSDKEVICSDGSSYFADLIIVGIGIHANKELAEETGLEVKNGVVVNDEARTIDKNVFAIGDCAFQYHSFYRRYVRLESIQNANDQAEIAASVICKQEVSNHSIPWFWSDQYDVKLQIIGLSEGANDIIIRQENNNKKKFSIWYFQDNKLLAVQAVNDMKAYVIGTKFIKENTPLDKSKLRDPDVELKPTNLKFM
ncbi:pyridine nucleotide-disulfide oxidoreductase [Labilibacter sediminis]|nr:pyridine nucleotide-disulfide oxidoreductase [Labilibacter sediminis]